MSDKISNRQEAILTAFQLGKEYSFSQIQKHIPETELVSNATLRRDLADLVEKQLLEQEGKLRGTRYRLTYLSMLNMPLTPYKYLSVEIDNRMGNTGFSFSLFDNVPDSLFSPENKKNLEEATQQYRTKSKNASEAIRQKELERFVIELSWKSSEIEGNTYSLLDTEQLLKEGVFAKGHTKDEAIMIINHKKAFQYILNNPLIHTYLSVNVIEDIHKILMDDLGVLLGIRTKPVGITGSLYAPLSVSTQIQEALETLCKVVNHLNDPYSKALLTLAGISYIQPFDDGNKRTARLAANAILLSYNCAPLSYRGIDSKEYLEAMLVFYEKNSIAPIRDIFIKQYFFSCEQYLQFN